MSKYTLSYTGEQTDTVVKKFFNSLNTVTVLTTSGSTVTMSKGGVTLYSVEDSGRWVFNPLEFGTWTITVFKDQLSAQSSLNIDHIGLYDVNISLS